MSMRTVLNSVEDPEKTANSTSTKVAEINPLAKIPLPSILVERKVFSPTLTSGSSSGVHAGMSMGEPRPSTANLGASSIHHDPRECLNRLARCNETIIPKVNLLFVEGAITPTSYRQFCEKQSVNPQDYIIVSGGAPTSSVGLYYPKKGGIAEQFNGSDIPTLTLPTQETLTAAEATHAIADLWRALGYALNIGKTPAFAIPMKGGEINLGEIEAKNNGYADYYRSQLKHFIAICKAEPLSIQSIREKLRNGTGTFFLHAFLEGFFNPPGRRQIFQYRSSASSTNTPILLEEKKEEALSAGVFPVITISPTEIPSVHPELSSKMHLLVPLPEDKDYLCDDKEDASVKGRDSQNRRGYASYLVDFTIFIVEPSLQQQAKSFAAIEMRLTSNYLPLLLSHLDVFDKGNNTKRLNELKSWLQQLKNQRGQFFAKMKRSFFSSENQFRPKDSSKVVEKILKEESLSNIFYLLRDEAAPKQGSNRHIEQNIFFKNIALAIVNHTPFASIHSPVVAVERKAQAEQQIRVDVSSSSSTIPGPK